MDVRQRTEEIERLTFAPWATFSDASRGRARPEPQDPIRPVFQRDRDRVIHCKAFRMTWATRPLVTQGRAHWTSSVRMASGITARACGWWTSWNRTAGAST